MVRVDFGHQRIALGGEPVHRLLCLAHQIDESRGVAAPDLTPAGYVVGGGEQKSRQQAHHRHAEAPRGTAGG